jgi:hypothetical protein
LKEQILNLQNRVSNLMQTVNDRTSETEMLRKRVNREVSLSNGIMESKALSPKSESSANREEVAGLKYVCFSMILICVKSKCKDILFRSCKRRIWLPRKELSSWNLKISCFLLRLVSFAR